MSNVLCLIFILFFFVIKASFQCSSYDFPCENGECIDAGLWCDTHKDCSDGSDEKYCKKSSIWKSNPNKCSAQYFKCDDGKCIPLIGRCDNYNNCDDLSDEKDCDDKAESSSNEYSSSASSPKTSVKETKTTTTRTTTHPAPTKAAKSSRDHYKSSGASQDSVEIVFSPEFRASDFSDQRKMAREWLLSQRRADFGWGDETPRALAALYLSDMRTSRKRNESDLLMVKQLEVQLSLQIARNSTKRMELTGLALYINALLASCRNPKNFYGDNLVRILRNGVDAAHAGSTFVNPSVYLTLCLNNASIYADVRKLHDIFLSRNAAIGRMDIQALALLSATCIFRKNTDLLSSSVYDGFRKQFFTRMNASGFPGNVYEAALLLQALQEMKTIQAGLLQFIRKEQQEDGSFGGILATYLVLPALAGRSFLQMNDHCAQEYTTDPAPIEVLKNSKRKKIFVQYSLNYGYPLEVTQTIRMHVAEGTNFLDIMRLAEEINPKYRFMLDSSRDAPTVYSIGGIPNDAEKGMYWTLHLVSTNPRSTREIGRLAPYIGSIKTLIPHAGDEFVFWMKSL